MSNKKLYSNDGLKWLIGKTIKSVFLSKDKRYILFRYTEDSDEKIDAIKGFLTFEAVGDCCSESWIENIEDVDNMMNCRVLSVELKMISKWLPGTKQDFDKVYGCTVTGKKSGKPVQFFIEMRNSSNGFHGGWFEKVCNDEFLFCITESDSSYFRLKEDF